MVALALAFGETQRKKENGGTENILGLLLAHHLKDIQTFRCVKR
jgi:hypothetical protein